MKLYNVEIYIKKQINIWLLIQNLQWYFYYKAGKNKQGRVPIF